MYTKERKSLHYWTTPILSCAHLSTTYTTLLHYSTTTYLTVCSSCCPHVTSYDFKTADLFLSSLHYYLLAIIFELPLLFLILLYLSTIIDSSCLKNYHTTTSPPCACLAKKVVIRTHKHLYTRASPFYNYIVVCCAPHR